MLRAGHVLNDTFEGLADTSGLMSVAGFGSLLSVNSARSTFPDLLHFRQGKIQGYRRVFAHTAAVFFQRGIARPETGETSSLSCEPCAGGEIVVSVFEVPFTPSAVQAFIEREHEFKLVVEKPLYLDGNLMGCVAVLCTKWTDAEYRAERCSPQEWDRRYTQHGVDRVWRDDVLPCRIYLRHCVLAAKKLSEQSSSEAAYNSFLDDTYLADRVTTVRTYLAQHPDIMNEEPPPELAARYSG